MHKLTSDGNIKEKKTLNEGSVSANIDKALKALISDLQNGVGVDKRAMEDSTDGELLAMVLRPVFQSELLKLKDRKGFKKNFKF